VQAAEKAFRQASAPALKAFATALEEFEASVKGLLGGDPSHHHHHGRRGAAGSTGSAGASGAAGVTAHQPFRRHGGSQPGPNGS